MWFLLPVSESLTPLLCCLQPDSPPNFSFSFQSPCPGNPGFSPLKSKYGFPSCLDPQYKSYFPSPLLLVFKSQISLSSFSKILFTVLAALFSLPFTLAPSLLAQSVLIFSSHTHPTDSSSQSPYLASPESPFSFLFQPSPQESRLISCHVCIRVK